MHICKEARRHEDMGLEHAHHHILDTIDSKFTPMPEKKSSEALEVGNGIVTERCCLITLPAINTDSNIG